MTTPNQNYSGADFAAGRQASQTERQVGQTARSIGDDVSDFASEAARKAGDFASDVSRQAGQQYRRARSTASDLYDEVHELSVKSPHISLGLAAAFGFLLGAYLVNRR
jgi:ElaB/YqjD/DUF883 family membrane-anchored ribosome-binding protein